VTYKTIYKIVMYDHLTIGRYCSSKTVVIGRWREACLNQIFLARLRFNYLYTSKGYSWGTRKIGEETYDVR
jgi:hypothetical protein